MKRIKSFPKNQIFRLIKDQGAKRISEDAVELLSDSIYNMAKDYAKRAVKISQYAKRKTVKLEDIKILFER